MTQLSQWVGCDVMQARYKFESVETRKVLLFCVFCLILSVRQFHGTLSKKLKEGPDVSSQMDNGTLTKAKRMRKCISLQRRALS